MPDRHYKSSDQVLTVERLTKLRPEQRYDDSELTSTLIFDFEFKTMLVISRVKSRSLGRSENTQLLPFSAVDDQLLQRMHQKLTDLGGAPDGLPLRDLKPLLPAPASIAPQDSLGKKPHPGAKP